MARLILAFLRPEDIAPLLQLSRRWRKDVVPRYTMEILERTFLELKLQLHLHFPKKFDYTQSSLLAHAKERFAAQLPAFSLQRLSAQVAQAGRTHRNGTPKLVAAFLRLCFGSIEQISKHQLVERLRSGERAVLALLRDLGAQKPPPRRSATVCELAVSELLEALELWEFDREDLYVVEHFAEFLGTLGVELQVVACVVVQVAFHNQGVRAQHMPRINAMEQDVKKYQWIVRKGLEPVYHMRKDCRRALDVSKNVYVNIVFSFLVFRDVLRVRAVCREFNYLAAVHARQNYATLVQTLRDDVALIENEPANSCRHKLKRDQYRDYFEDQDFARNPIFLGGKDGNKVSLKIARIKESLIEQYHQKDITLFVLRNLLRQQRLLQEGLMSSTE